LKESGFESVGYVRVAIEIEWAFFDSGAWGWPASAKAGVDGKGGLIWLEKIRRFALVNSGLKGQKS